MRVIFIENQGAKHEVAGNADDTVMRCAANNLIPGIIGECGGAMACGTCHGYVDHAWISKIPPPTAQEQDMIDGCMDTKPNSRLTCQIRLTPELDGLTVHVPSTQT